MRLERKSATVKARCSLFLILASSPLLAVRAERSAAFHKRSFLSYGLKFSAGVEKPDRKFGKTRGFVAP